MENVFAGVSGWLAKSCGFVQEREASTDVDLDKPSARSSGGAGAAESSSSDDDIEVASPSLPAAQLSRASMDDAVISGWSNAPGVEKYGAGLLFVNSATDEVLLLLRNSWNNGDTWGLPGGNREPVDRSPLQTASREAVEELGTLPPFTVTGVATVVRGKMGQKHFAVHVCDVQPAVVSSYVPKLNYEHSAWMWIPVRDVVKSARKKKGGKWPLHPVVKIFFSEHWARFASSEGAAATSR